MFNVMVSSATPAVAVGVLFRVYALFVWSHVSANTNCPMSTGHISTKKGTNSAQRRLTPPRQTKLCWLRHHAPGFRFFKTAKYKNRKELGDAKQCGHNVRTGGPNSNETPVSSGGEGLVALPHLFVPFRAYHEYQDWAWKTQSEPVRWDLVVK